MRYSSTRLTIVLHGCICCLVWATFSVGLDSDAWAAEEAPSNKGKLLAELIEDLNNDKRSVRISAIRALIALKEKASPAAPRLIEIVRSDDHTIVRRYATRGLGYLGSGEAKTALVLIETLKDEQALIRKEARYALARIGAPSESVIGAIVGKLADNNPEVQFQTALLLRRAQQITPESLTAIEDAMVKTRGRTRMHLALLLGANRRVTSKSAPGLIDAMKIFDQQGGMFGRRYVPGNPSHSGIGKEAAIALMNIGPDSKDAVPDLVEALKFERIVHRESFIFGTRSTEDQGVFVREHAAFALGRIGPAAKIAVPALREAAKDKNNRVRRAAFFAIYSISPDDVEGLPPPKLKIDDKTVFYTIQVAYLFSHATYQAIYNPVAKSLLLVGSTLRTPFEGH